MSSEKKNPIEELIEVLSAVNESLGDMPQPEPTTPPTSPVGFESLIPDSVMQKVQEVKKVADELNKELLKMTASVLAKDHKDEYAQFQLVMFMDTYAEMREALGRLSHIHEVDKPMIDDVAKEQGMPVKMFIHSFLAQKAMETMLNR